MAIGLLACFQCFAFVLPLWLQFNTALTILNRTLNLSNTWMNVPIISGQEWRYLFVLISATIHFKTVSWFCVGFGGTTLQTVLKKSLSCQQPCGIELLVEEAGLDGVDGAGGRRWNWESWLTRETNIDLRNWRTLNRKQELWWVDELVRDGLA